MGAGSNRTRRRRVRHADTFHSETGGRPTTKVYQVIAWDEEDHIVQKSDPHTWEKLEEIYHDYLERDDTVSIAIIYIGRTDD